jgi:hypothetical protein
MPMSGAISGFMMTIGKHEARLCSGSVKSSQL